MNSSDIALNIDPVDNGPRVIQTHNPSFKPPRDPMLDFLMIPPDDRPEQAPGIAEAVLAAAHSLAETAAATPVLDDYKFEEFPKIARLNRDCIVTEKIDGVNAQIVIAPRSAASIPPTLALVGDYAIFAGSRTRWVTPTDDQNGLAKWVIANAEEIVKLGPGRHYGEWWGSGIRRGYGLPQGEKRFSLFNTSRWTEENTPACVNVVPILYRGLFTTQAINNTLDCLRVVGSKASPGFKRPEGIIVFHLAANVFFKVTLEKDEQPKSVAAAA